MKVVQPIRDFEKLEEIQRILKGRNERNYILLMVGLYTALRISDILRIRVEDIQKEYLNIREQKTSKYRRVYLNPTLKKALRDYTANKQGHEFLIRSREGGNRPISRAMAYQILKEVAEEVGLDSIGTHSLRKTFGYWVYKDTKDVAALQKLFNHSNPEETLRYIGIEQDSVDSLIRNVYKNGRN